MEDTLLSPYWYRIAALHPRLRPHVSVRMQTTRGQAWYVLFNQATGRYHRVNAQAYELVGRLDGRQSVDEVWQVLLGLQGDEAPSQHDVIRILGQLTDAGLVQAEVTPDVRQMLVIDQERTRRERRSRLNPLSFRLGLFNPSAVLEAVLPWTRWVFSAPALLAWFAVLLLGGGAALVNLDEIATYAHRHFMTPGFLAMAWVAYPLMKAVHELGHSLALRRFGCEVPEVGVNFFMFVPMPYVDASASNRLTSRWQRALISAAGIIVETTLASLALALWLTLEDGPARELVFVVMALGGLSTVLFNGNPLMKFDGYFVASDVLDLPNLANRSAQATAVAWRRLIGWLLRMPADPTLAGAAGSDVLERWALRLYAPLSWLYRAGVSGLMVSWASEKSSWLGIGILLWTVWSMILAPLKSWCDALMQSPDFDMVRGRAFVGGAVVAIAMVTALAWIPVPSSTVAQGVVWLPPDAQIRATSDSQVEAVMVRSGQHVDAGQALIELADPSLETRRAILQARIASSEAEMNAAFTSDSMKVSNAQEAATRDRAELAQVERDMGQQMLRAHAAGEFVLSRQEDIEQRQVSRGQLLAYVLTDGPSVVRMVVPQKDVDEIRHRLKSATVMLDEQPGRVWSARRSGEVPAAIERLPHANLGDRAGGPVPTDPGDAEGLRATEPLFVMDVVLSDRLPRAGGLARVRLDLAPQPLLKTAAMRVRQLFLRHFSDVNSDTNSNANSMTKRTGP